MAHVGSLCKPFKSMYSCHSRAHSLTHSLSLSLYLFLSVSVLSRYMYTNIYVYIYIYIYDVAYSHFIPVKKAPHVVNSPVVVGPDQRKS